VVLLTSLTSYTLFIFKEVKQHVDELTPVVFETKTILSSQNIMALPEKIAQLKTGKEKIQASIKNWPFIKIFLLLNNIILMEKDFSK
jgi:hypothetical protein